MGLFSEKVMEGTASVMEDFQVKAEGRWDCAAAPRRAANGRAGSTWRGGVKKMKQQLIMKILVSASKPAQAPPAKHNSLNPNRFKRH